MKKVFNWFTRIRISMLHAEFHRNMKRAEQARTNRDIGKFKQHIYRAEDAWRKIVILTQKIKANG